MPPPTQGRRYAGADAEERRAARRGRLLEAGLERFGTDGYATTPVEAICSQAGLSPRYFYESFTSREDLLVAVFEEVIALVRDRVVAAVAAQPLELRLRVRAGVSAFMHSLADDERKARVQLLEVVGVSPSLEARRREVLHEFVDLVAADAQQLMDAGALPRRDVRLTALALVGATNELILDWVQAEPARRPRIDRLVDEATRLYVAATVSARR